MKIAIVIPAFNEQDSLVETFNRLPENYKKSSHIILIDDGSFDSTLEIASQLIDPKKDFILSHSKNKGYGAAQKTGFLKALELDVDLVVLLHADGQYPPEEIAPLVSPIITKGVDVVVGSNMLCKGVMGRGMPFYKFLGNKILSFFENLCFGTKLTGFHSGFRAYSKNFLRDLNFDEMTDFFHFDSEIIAKAKKKGFTIKEIPIPAIYFKKSNLNSLKYGFCIIALCLKNIKKT